MKLSQKYKFVCFLIIFFIINLLQSKYTLLLGDEAYYWVWSKDLALGYFDHPPLVALWIRIGSLFFEGELGVRFFSTISFSLMLIIIWLIIDHKEKWKNVWLYFLLIASVALLNAYGFIVTPDTPLLLFVTLFLFAYKRFLQNDSWVNILLLGFFMAGMLYSKYHGVLVIFFVIISNISLLKNKKFWMAGFFGFLLFLPHLYWQYVNDFPSFRYHLAERGIKSYNITYSLMHFVNQIAIVGITFPVIYKAFYKQKIASKFDKSLKYITIGLIGFFFFSTFSIKPQAQWTVVILIPLIILSFPYFIQHQKARKWLIILGSIQFVILLMIRGFLANENISPLKLEPHVSQTWINPLKEKTKSKPIVFISSYRNASLYAFYTGIKTHSYSLLKKRKSQYDLSNSEEKIQHENVYIISKPLVRSPHLIEEKEEFLNKNRILNYSTFQKVKCIINSENLLFETGKNINFTFTFINTYNKNINFENVTFIGVFQGHKNELITTVPLKINNLSNLIALQEKIVDANFTMPEIAYEGEITFRVALQFYNLAEGFQGNKVNVILKNE